MFGLGKSIGIAGRVAVAIFVVVALVACAVDLRSLLLSFLVGEVLVAVAVVTEVVSSVLMLLGNWIAARLVKKL